MIKKFLILISGIATLQCACVAFGDQSLFNDVGHDSGARLAPVSQAPSSRPLTDQNADQDSNEAPARVMASLDNTYRLGPGDTVLYQVIEDQDAPTNLVVTDSGDLNVPYYGLVHAAGKTCRQLADQIKTLLQKKLYYRATVVLALEVANKNWVTGRVYVTGQVKNPGSYPIPAAEDMTVSKAILAAGGFSDFSDKKRVRLIHKTPQGEQTYVVNVVKVWDGHTSLDMPVQPGDMVVVPASLVNY